MRSPYVANGLLWLFLLAIATITAMFFGLNATLAFVLGANFAAFALFFIDKNAAGTVLGRVPEVVLYVALWFGILGGFAGMSLMRHKTRKMPFQLIAVLMLLVQLAIAALVIMPHVFSDVPGFGSVLP